MTAVLKHELRAYFHSLTAYVFGAFLLAFVGIGAMMYNLQAAVSNFEYVLSFGCLVFVVIVPILTISASTSSLLKVMMIGVFPLLYLGIGICVVLTRRKKQNETV